MMNVPKVLAIGATRIASETDADAIIVFIENDLNCSTVLGQGPASFCGEKPKLVAVTSSQKVCERLKKIHGLSVIKLVARRRDTEDQFKQAIAQGMREGIFRAGQKLVCLTSAEPSGVLDTISIRNVTGFEATLAAIERDPVLAATIELAIELGSGRPVGTAFMVGDSRGVIRRSRQLMLNPLRGYSVMITERGHWPTIQKYAAVLDGAFVVDDSGRIISAARYLDADAKVDIPKGLGTRHIAVAAMTAVTKATGVTISGGDGMVRVFRRGDIEAKIEPLSRSMEQR